MAWPLCWLTYHRAETAGCRSQEPRQIFLDSWPWKTHLEGVLLTGPLTGAMQPMPKETQRGRDRGARRRLLGGVLAFLGMVLPTFRLYPAQMRHSTPHQPFRRAGFQTPSKKALRWPGERPSLPYLRPFHSRVGVPHSVAFSSFAETPSLTPFPSWGLSLRAHGSVLNGTRHTAGAQHMLAFFSRSQPPFAALVLPSVLTQCRLQIH